MWRACCRASGAAAIAIMLVLGAMAYASAADVRDFEDFAASDIVITPDPSGRAATREVDTSIDVARSVVFGPGESFGLIPVGQAVDPGDVTAQELRFDVVASTGGNTGAIEILVLAPS